MNPSRLRLLVACTLLLALVAGRTAAADKPAKKLIEFGWDEPDTAFMRAHVAEMEQTPFDGVVFHFKGDLTWQSWGTRKLEDKDIKAGIDDLKAMLKPYDPALMEAYAVNRAVNSVKNDTEECIEPVADPG